MWDLPGPGIEPVSPALAGGFFFFFFINLLYYFILFIYCFWLHWVFVAVHGLFSGCGKWELLFVAVHGLLIAVASLVAEHGL